MAQALQQHLDVRGRVPDPFLLLLHYPTGVLDGSRLYGANDAIKLVEIEFVVFLRVRLDRKNLDVLSLLVVPALYWPLFFLPFDFHDQPAVLVGLERHLAVADVVRQR